MANPKPYMLMMRGGGGIHFHVLAVQNKLKLVKKEEAKAEMESIINNVQGCLL